MPALLHASGNPSQRELRRPDLQVRNLDAIARSLHIAEASCITNAAQRTFERKALAGAGETIQFRKKNPPRGYGCIVGFERTQSARDKIRVHEMYKPRFFR